MFDAEGLAGGFRGGFRPAAGCTGPEKNKNNIYNDNITNPNMNVKRTHI